MSKCIAFVDDDERFLDQSREQLTYRGWLSLLNRVAFRGWFWHRVPDTQCQNEGGRQQGARRDLRRHSAECRRVGRDLKAGAEKNCTGGWMRS